MSNLIMSISVTSAGLSQMGGKGASLARLAVGAPLSNAAIVARELGIPAVVGCGNATMLLKTGDRVRVDGGSGTVEILTR